MPPLSTLAQTVQTTLTSALVAAGSILLSGVAKHLVAVANRKGPREPPEEPREDEPAGLGPAEEAKESLQEPLLDDSSA